MSPPSVTLGNKQLSPWQKQGLESISWGKGRDIIFAIDLTESVGINDQGRTHLRQIIQDSLQPGDSVYVIPFATQVFLSAQPIQYRKAEDVEQIIQAVPQQPDLKLANTDIQCAELEIYRYVAQLNQGRLNTNQPVKFQSIVWITDAPLNTEPGQVWIEAPNSPCGAVNTPESAERMAWLESLALKQRSIKPGKFELTVVDIPATVQEFCTPAPGGKETCLVNPYLVKQLWLPGLLLGIVILAITGSGIFWFQRRKKLNTPWTLKIEAGSEEPARLLLPNNRRIAIGGFDADCHDHIPTPEGKVRAYLERRGNRLQLIPNHTDQPILFNEQPLQRQTEINNRMINLNCPDSKGRDFFISIRIS